MTDYIFEGKPGNIFDDIDKYNQEMFENKITLEHVQHKHILLTIKAEDDEEHDTIIKIKFYEYGPETLLVNFSRKSGNILKWYDLLKNMKETELQYLRFPFVE